MRSEGEGPKIWDYHQEVVGLLAQADVDARGQVSQLKLPSKLSSGSASFSYWMFERVLLPLPEEPVGVGDTWETPIDLIGLGFGEGYKGKVKNTLVKFENGRATIEQILKLKDETGKGQKGTEWKVKKATGSLVLNLDPLSIESSQTKLNILMKDPRGQDPGANMVFTIALQKVVPEQSIREQLLARAAQEEGRAPDLPPNAHKGRRLAMVARLDPATATPGSEVTLYVTIAMQDGWHTYGAKETASAPISLRVDPIELELPEEPMIPAGIAQEVAGKKAQILDGIYVLRQKIRIPANAKYGRIGVRARVAYTAGNGQEHDPLAQALLDTSLQVSGPSMVKNNFDLAVKEAQLQKKQVLVTFSGLTCVNCRYMERGLFLKPAIAKVLTENYVEARLYTDAIDSEFFQKNIALRDKYVGEGDGGLPMLFILDPNKLDQPIREQRGAPGEDRLLEFLTGK